MSDNEKPELPKLKRLTPEQELRKDAGRIGMILGILRHLDQLSHDENNKRAKKDLQIELRDLLDHWVSSGGVGGEVITRLQGLGTVQDFPIVNKIDERKSTDSLDGSVVVSQNRDGSKTIIVHTYFISAPLDTETFTEPVNPSSWEKDTFAVNMEFTIPSEGLAGHITQLQQQYKQVFSDIKALKASSQG